MEKELQQGGFARRLGAVLVDWVLAGLASNLFVNPKTWQSLPVRHFIFFLMMFVGVTFTQSSLGQKLFRLKVIAYPTGNFITPKQAFIRTFSLVLFIPAIFTKDSRGFHDWYAHTIVVSST